MRSVIFGLILSCLSGVLTVDEVKHNHLRNGDLWPQIRQHGITERTREERELHNDNNLLGPESETAASGYRDVLLKITKACANTVSRKLHHTGTKRLKVNRCNKKLISLVKSKRRKRSRRTTQKRSSKHKLKKNSAMADLPQPAKPLTVVAASSAIKSRLKGLKPPIKAIHIWGTTPFKVFMSRLARLHKNIQQQRKAVGSMKRLFTPLQPFMLSQLANLKAQQPLHDGNGVNLQQQQAPIMEEVPEKKFEQYADAIQQPAQQQPVFEELPRKSQEIHFNGKLQDAVPFPFHNGIQEVPFEQTEEVHEQQVPANGGGVPYFMPYQGFPPPYRERVESYQEPFVPHFYPGEFLGGMHHHGHHIHAALLSKAKCKPNPCKNDGICTVFEHGFECTCPQGFMGHTCEQSNQCLPNPCKNGGNCYPKADSYECSCLRGYKGANCHIASRCIPNPCHNGGTCEEGGEVYTCHCPASYRGYKCEAVDHCSVRNPCKNGGSCTNGESSFTCQCPVGYTGNDCGDLDLCHSSPCQNGGTCSNNAAGSFMCHCSAFFKGIICEEKISFCESNPCHNEGRCVEDPTGAGFHCQCLPKYVGQLCTERKNPCDISPCQNGGMCLDKGEDFKCFCTEGFAGTTCEVVVNTGCSSCHPNAQCTGGTCVCLLGFHGDGKVCEATSQCHPNPCYNGGTCRDTADGFVCECTGSFSGKLCKETKPCLSAPCLNGATCIDVGPGHYQCQCADGYSGINCEESPCLSKPCQNGGTCIIKGTSYICECTERFEGAKCSEDKCADCDIHAHCETDHCVCDSGFKGSGAKGDCFIVGGSQPRFCVPNPCKNGGKCIEGVSGNTCECPSDFDGANCELPVGRNMPKEPDPCKPSPCQNGGTCTPQTNPTDQMELRRSNTRTRRATAADGAFKCTCPTNYEGDLCEKAVKVYCHPNPCLYGGTCQEAKNGYNCSCVGHYRGTNCQDDDCDNCDIHAICVLGACRCRVGYHGDGFQCTKIHKCHGCSPHASCLGTQCVCLPGYIGNGVTCHKAVCDACPPHSKCIFGICVCLEGFYFNGKHCIAPPSKSTDESDCPSICATQCVPTCPKHCCKVTIKPLCPSYCATDCVSSCPHHCCSPSPSCPSYCSQTNPCPSSCASHCCTQTPQCPAYCSNNNNCRPTCPPQCCSPAHTRPTAVCPASCNTICLTSCPQHCCKSSGLSIPLPATSSSSPSQPPCPLGCTENCAASCPSYCCLLYEPPQKKSLASKDEYLKSKANMIHALSQILDSPLKRCPPLCFVQCSSSCPKECCGAKRKKKNEISRHAIKKKRLTKKKLKRAKKLILRTQE